jgi:signal recognition particle receptor subunit beta
MALFNYASKDLTLKVVYYGPGLSGKTTNLQYLHSKFEPGKKGKLLSLSTESDRTLFFDFLPVDLGKIKEFRVRFQLYTVPGQVRYNATRKLVLKGADAIVFVADSQNEMKEHNIESMEDMRENLVSNNIELSTVPMVFQYNKRDLPNIMTVLEIDSDINHAGLPVIEAEAINGKGVEETFQTITKILIKDFANRYNVQFEKAAREETYLSKTVVPFQKSQPARPEPFEMPEMVRLETARMLDEIPIRPQIKTSPVREESGPATAPEERIFEQEVPALKDVLITEEALNLREIPAAEEASVYEEVPPAQIEPVQEKAASELEISLLAESIQKLGSELQEKFSKLQEFMEREKKTTLEMSPDLSRALSRLNRELEGLRELHVSKAFSEDMIIELLNTVRHLKAEQARILSLVSDLGLKEPHRKRLFGIF